MSARCLFDSHLRDSAASRPHFDSTINDQLLLLLWYSFIFEKVNNVRHRIRQNRSALLCCCYLLIGSAYRIQFYLFTLLNWSVVMESVVVFPSIDVNDTSRRPMNRNHVWPWKLVKMHWCVCLSVRWTRCSSIVAACERCERKEKEKKNHEYMKWIQGNFTDK